MKYQEDHLIRVILGPGTMMMSMVGDPERNDMRFPHATTQNGTQFKTYELFTS